MRSLRYLIIFIVVGGIYWLTNKEEGGIDSTSQFKVRASKAYRVFSLIFMLVAIGGVFYFNDTMVPELNGDEVVIPFVNFFGIMLVLTVGISIYYYSKNYISVDNDVVSFYKLGKAVQVYKLDDIEKVGVNATRVTFTFKDDVQIKYEKSYMVGMGTLISIVDENIRIRHAKSNF